MKKFLLIIVLALLLGVGFSKFIFNQYEEPVNIEFDKVIFIQQGVYSSYESMQENTKKLEHYTYEKIGDKYYVYVCFTKKNENVSIIKKYFDSLNYTTYAKEMNFKNEAFLNVLDQYDYLMGAVENVETIKNICKQIVTKYDEVKIE